MESQKIKLPGRIFRVTLCTLLPVFLFVSGLGVFGLLNIGTPEAGILNFLVIALFMGYIITGVQSLISALLMEFVINPKVPGNVAAVLLGGLLGGLSGLSVLLAFDPANTRMMILIAIGFVIGLIVGALSRWHFQRDLRRQSAAKPAQDDIPSQSIS